jgi:alpha-ketoglutarate-dependent taurine dioxygenase
MNLVKLPNMPEPFGYQVTDIDLKTASKAEIVELANLCKQHLVITIKKADISKERFAMICYSWGSPHKYAEMDKFTDPETRGDLERMSFPHLPGLGRVTGIRDDKGNRTGMFADGQLDWHCNQSGTINPKSVVALQGVEGTHGTHTQFVEGVTAYNLLSAEDKAVVDGLVSVYGFKLDAVGPGASAAQQAIVQMNQNPEDGFEKPLVAVSPGGHRGINFSYTTIKGFKGKTEAENAELFDWLKRQVLVDERVYTHAWDDGDVLFMDQIVTLHKRPTEDCSKRLLHRMAFDFSKIDGGK